MQRPWPGVQLDLHAMQSVYSVRTQQLAVHGLLPGASIAIMTALPACAEKCAETSTVLLASWFKLNPGMSSTTCPPACSGVVVLFRLIQSYRHCAALTCDAQHCPPLGKAGTLLVPL
jgi:hypothetical protein